MAPSGPGEMEKQGRGEGWPCAPPPFPQIQEGDPQLPLCVSCKMEGRKKSASPHLASSVLWGFKFSCHGPRRGNGSGEGEEGTMARGSGSGMEGQSTWQASRLQRELGWQVTGPGNWSPGGPHGLAGERVSSSLSALDGGAVAPGCSIPALGETENQPGLPAHSPGPVGTLGPPSLCRISGASVLTSTSAEGSSCNPLPGRLLPASVSAPGRQHPTPTPDPCAWPCTCVPCVRMCMRPCVHTHHI